MSAKKPDGENKNISQRKKTLTTLAAVFAAAVSVGGCSGNIPGFQNKACTPESTADIVERIKPIGQVTIEGDAPAELESQETPEIPAPPAKPAAPVIDANTGKTVYDANCSTCHSVGVAGAPRVGNKSDWSARILRGEDSLSKDAIAGFGVMPPKGGARHLSDEEVKEAVKYMVLKSK